MVSENVASMAARILMMSLSLSEDAGGHCKSATAGGQIRRNLLVLGLAVSFLRLNLTPAREELEI